jgi:hypothetical protein
MENYSLSVFQEILLTSKESLSDNMEAVKKKFEVLKTKD